VSTAIAGSGPEPGVLRQPEMARHAGATGAIHGAPVTRCKIAPERCTVVLAVALVTAFVLASGAAAQEPHTRRTYAVVGVRDCALLVDGARALGLSASRTDGVGTCRVTVTGPLPQVRAIDATVDDLTDTGGCATSE